MSRWPGSSARRVCGSGWRSVAPPRRCGCIGTGGRLPRWLVLVAWAWHVLAYTAPPLLGIGRPWWRLAAVLGVAERALLELKTGGRDWAAALAVAASPIAAIPAVGLGLRRQQVWRGRSYPT